MRRTGRNGGPDAVWRMVRSEEPLVDRTGIRPDSRRKERSFHHSHHCEWYFGFHISLVQGYRASPPVAAEQYRNQSRIRPGEAKSKDLVLARRAPHQRPRVSHFHRSGQARDPFSRRADSSNSILSSTWKVPRWEVVERRSPIAGFLYGGDSYRRSKWEVRVRALALFRKASA